MTLTLLPAVDLAGGQAVRLVQGEAGTETGYGDPVEPATGFADQGARWLHVVDLDAAFGRGPRNRDQLAAIIKDLHDLRDSARNSRMKALEKKAQSLAQSLEAAHTKLRDAIQSQS